MQRTLLRSKIHRATVTDANLHYPGSITIDRELMDLAGLVGFEKVHVVDIDNGARIETYVIEGSPGSGTVCLNGAAARLVHKGDKVIVLAYAGLDEAEIDSFRPSVVVVGEDNRPLPSFEQAAV